LVVGCAGVDGDEQVKWPADQHAGASEILVLNAFGVIPVEDLRA